MEKITIKAIPNPDNPQLSLKYIGAKDYIIPGIGPDGKRITGIDENALSVMRIEDAKIRKKVQDDIKKERENLERLLGNDLSVSSPYWDKFSVVVEDGVDLDLSNPLHRLMEKFLIANKKVAPDEESVEDGDGEFSNCLFYFFREDEEISKKAKKEQLVDKIVSKLFMYSETNPGRLIKIYSYVFGYEAKNDVSPSLAYTKLKELVTVKDRNQLTQNIDKLNMVITLSPEELNTKLVLDKAINKKYVSTVGGIHRRGDVILGNDYEEALKYLLLPENSAELDSLNKEVSAS